MTGRKPQRRQQHSAEPAATPPDWWDKWFSRLVQLSGLGVVAHELLFEREQRPWLLLMAAGMIVGSIGLQLIVRWAVRRLGSIDE